MARWLHRVPHLGIEDVEVVVGRDPHLQSTQPSLQSGGVVGHGDRHRAGVQGIVAGDGLEHQGAVAGTPGQGADVVAVEAGHQEPSLAYSTVGLLEPHDAAEGPGHTYRSAQVGAQGSVSDTCRHVGAASSAGAARDAVQSPRVVDRPVVGVVGGHPGGELLQVLLPQDDGPSPFAKGDHVGVLLGDVLREHLGCHRSADAAGGDVVFDADGDAVERAPVLPRCQGLLLLSGALQRLLVEYRDKGVQGGLEPVRLGQGRLRHLHGRDLPRPDPQRQLGDGERCQLWARRQDWPPS